MHNDPLNRQPLRPRLIIGLTLLLFIPCLRSHADGMALIPETAWIQPGTTFTVGVQISTQPGWHTYWLNPGDSGMAPALHWTLPDGIRMGALHFPTPHYMEADGLVTYGYENEVTLLADFHADSTLQGTGVVLRLNAQWMVCLDMCMFRKQSVELSIPVKPTKPPRRLVTTNRFDAARAALPVPMPGWTAQAQAVGSEWLLHITPPPGHPFNPESGIQFFAMKRGAVNPTPTGTWNRQEAQWTLRLPKGPEPPAAPETLDGILVFPSNRTDPPHPPAILIRATILPPG